MQENEIVTAEPEVVEEVSAAEVQTDAAVQQTKMEKPPFMQRVGAGIKEWFRKFIVNLKRRPMNIGLFVLAISTVVVLCSLGNLSQLGLSGEYNKQGQGLCIFVEILFGILILLLYMNAFPKRDKKPKLVMYILTIVFMVLLIALDIYLYVMWGKNRQADIIRLGDTNPDYWVALDTFYYGALAGVMAHAILVAISMVLMVTSPLIGKALNKINTKVELEETQLKEAIDVEDE